MKKQYDTTTLGVDAQGLIKQSFHGNKNMYGSNGQHIGAIFTFFTIIRKVINEVKPTKVILFWDGPQSGKLRHDIYPLYKSNRDKDYNEGEFLMTDKDFEQKEKDKKSILKQRIRIQEYAEELFFRQVEDELTEADDCIAYYVNNVKAPNEKVIIYSNDRDMMQLMDDDVEIYLANQRAVITKENYFLYFDHHYENSSLIKAIEGCDSDYILGVAGVKETTILNYFPELKKTKGNIEDIVEKARLLNEERTAPVGKRKGKEPYKALTNLVEGITKEPIMVEGIENGVDLIKLNYKLVDLKNPFITEECKEMVEDYTTLPIDDENRGSKNLLKMMMADGFINHIVGGHDGYLNYLVPFIPIAKREKKFYADSK